MTTKLPRATQRGMLKQLRDAGLVVKQDDGRVWPRIGTPSQVAALEEAGWVTSESNALALTPAGFEALEDADALAAYRESADQEVRVTRRARGRSPIKGVANPGDGRNVRCNYCYRAARAAVAAGQSRGQPDSIVWFSNQAGANAQRAAEIAAGKHLLRHASGELSSPKRG